MKVFLVVEKADFFLIQELRKPIPDGFTLGGDLALIVEENANGAVVEKVSLKCNLSCMSYISSPIFLC